MKEQAVRFDFLKYWKFWMGFSGVLTLLGIAAMIWNSTTIGFPLNRGVDFTGGTLLQLTYPTTVEQKELFDIVSRQVTKEPVVQTGPLAGGATQVVIRAEPGVRDKIMTALNQSKPGFVVDAQDEVEPAFGAELAMWGAIALLIAWILILVYIAFRYRFTFGVGAIASLLHDAVMVLGIYALFRIEVNTPFVGAMLTVLGYSVNDTVVISDRIRENLRLHKGTNLMKLANLSLNQTLRRTLLTSGSTLLPVFALLIFGGPTLKTFVLAMAIGFFSGVYSTWFIAIPVMLLLEGAVRFRREVVASVDGRTAPVPQSAPSGAASTSSARPVTAGGGDGGSDAAEYRRRKKRARRR
ncbi:MAG: protein translocase subunit SecF [bacterium]